MLWGINWMNVQLFIADAARPKERNAQDDSGDINIRLDSEEAIKNYIDNMM